MDLINFFSILFQVKTKAYIQIFLVIFLFFTACSNSNTKQPIRFALLPASTVRVIVFENTKTLNDPAVNGTFDIPLFTSTLQQANLNFDSIKNPILVGTNSSGACIFNHDNASEVISRIQGNTKTFSDQEVREVTVNQKGIQSTWWAKIDDKTIVFGGEIAVAEIISVVQQKSQNLFHARSELQPILSNFENSSSAFFVFLPIEEENVATGAKIASRFILNSPQGQLFRMFASTVGMVYTVNPTNEGCEAGWGFQYSGYVSSLLSSGLLTAFPYGPDEIQPIGKRTERNDNLVKAFLTYKKVDCPRIGLGLHRLPLDNSKNTKASLKEPEKVEPNNPSNSAINTELPKENNQTINEIENNENRDISNNSKSPKEEKSFDSPYASSDRDKPEPLKEKEFFDSPYAPSNRDETVSKSTPKSQSTLPVYDGCIIQNNAKVVDIKDNVLILNSRTKIYILSVSGGLAVVKTESGFLGITQGNNITTLRCEDYFINK